METAHRARTAAFGGDSVPKWSATADEYGHFGSPWRYDDAACHAIETPIPQCSAISYCASRQSPERPSPPAWTLLASVLSLAAAV